MNFTIFQKMLIAPVVAVALYCCYFLVAYVADRQVRAAVQAMQDEYLPAMELAGEDVLLFDNLVTQMKDAVSSGEVSWLNHSRQTMNQILDNLSGLEHYQVAIPVAETQHLRENLVLYYQNAFALSRMMLAEKADVPLRNTLIENVAHYHGAVSGLLNDHKRIIQERVHLAVQQTKQRLNNLLTAGVSLGVFMMLAVIGLTLHLSLTTRKRFSEVIDRMKDLAQGQPDFSKRLAQHKRDELGVLIEWFNRLSDKLERDHKEIELLSITDKLTALYNRTKIDRLFADELKRTERYGDGFSVILIDLDHFKSVNDSYGHQAGDSVLQELSRLLRACVRETDHLGRWGGEEFIVILPNADMACAMQLAEKLRKSIDEHSFSGVGHKTASFGVASYRAGDDVDSMTRRADNFLYLAKEAGRNQVIGEAESG